MDIGRESSRYVVRVRWRGGDCSGVRWRGPLAFSIISLWYAINHLHARDYTKTMHLEHSISGLHRLYVIHCQQYDVHVLYTQCVKHSRYTLIVN